MTAASPTKPLHETFLRTVEINPGLAAAWLEKNTRNRPVRSSVVHHYARQMRDGAWELNGETIKFDWNGDLLDGQHRLMAVIEAGVTIRSDVRFDLPPDAFHTIDVGLKRSAGDALSIRGEQYGVHLAATLTLLWRYEQGIWSHGAPPNPTIPELEELLERHPSVRESLPWGARLGKLLPPTISITLHYLFSQRDPELAQLFFEGLASGVGLQVNDPVRILRERLLRERVGKARLPRKEVLALALKAWNFTRENKQISALRWRSQGDAAEPFPDVL